MDALVDQLDEAGQPRWLLRLLAALNRGRRPRLDRDLEPHLTAIELLAWAQDDGRWDKRAAKGWRSLLDDVDHAWSRLGPSLKAFADVEADLQALRLGRKEAPTSIAPALLPPYSPRLAMRSRRRREAERHVHEMIDGDVREELRCVVASRSVA